MNPMQMNPYAMNPFASPQQNAQNYMAPFQNQMNNVAAQMQAFQAQSTPQSQIEYVNGLESARAYSLAPNSSKLLMDSTMARFYIKQSDASGFCSIKAFDFMEVQENAPSTEYVSRAEFDELKGQINQYVEMFTQPQKAPRKANNKATEVSDNG